MCDALLTETFDVEGAPRGEVHDLLQLLGGTGRIHAVGVALVTHALEHAAAVRTRGRKLPRRLSTTTRFAHRAHDFGNHVAGLVHDHEVPGAHVLHLHLVLVVQRRHRDRRTGDDDRLENGEGRHPTSAPDRDFNIEQTRRSLLGGKLPRDRPPRRAARESQPQSLGQVVDLHHDAIDLIAKFVAVRFEPIATSDHRRRADFGRRLGGGEETPVRQLRQSLDVAGEG